MNDLIVTIDRLGAETPETPEMRDERKAAESPARQALNAVLMTVVLTVAGLVLMGAGVYIGATKPAAWNHLPFVPSLSGERAEPEESAK